MAALRHVEECEFRDRATQYLSGNEPIAIHRGGKIIGIYTPMHRDIEAARQALDQFDKTVDKILEETGMTRDELADLFDLSKPFE